MKINYGKLMYQTAITYPNKIALYHVERKRAFTFMELHLLTNKITNMTKDRFGLKTGDIYVCLLKNDNFTLFSHWTAKGEAAKQWMNYRDSVDEHLYQIDYLKPKLAFIENEILDNYYEAFRYRNIEIVCMDKPEKVPEGVHYFWDLIAEAKDDESEVEIDLGEHIVDYRFTGGTTGQGKCCMYTMGNNLNSYYQLLSHRENIFDENDRFLHIHPTTHGSSLWILPIFLRGGTTYTINDTDLSLFCETVEKEKITASFFVPTLLYRLLETTLEQQYDLSSLKTVAYAAAPMSPKKLELLLERFGNIFVQSYGSSEAVPVCLVLGKSDHVIKTEDDRKRLASCGKALVGVEIKMADGNGNEVPNGSIGEIWLRTASVIKGYYKNEEETAKAFTKDNFWKSGDLGYMDQQGYVYIVDRSKDMIVSGGFNVYAAEVENVLNSHPAVQLAVVIGIPHSEWGEAVHAEVILKKNTQVSEDDLINFCKENIAKYKSPKSITFVEDIPLSPVGKVLRRVVKEKYWKGQERKVH